MQLTMVEYKGVQYPARKTKEGLIAHTDLQNVLLDEDYKAIDAESRAMDEKIYGFASMDELQLPERELLNLFK